MSVSTVLVAGFAVLAGVQALVGWWVIWRVNRKLVEAFERSQGRLWRHTDRVLEELHDPDSRESKLRNELYYKVFDLNDEIERREFDKERRLTRGEISKILGF